MAKKVLWILFAVVLVLALVTAGGVGYFWYQNNHIFVEDAVYPISARELDLRGQDISFEHYDAVHSQLPLCDIYWDVPFQGGKYSNNSQSLTVSSLTEKDIQILKTYFPRLKTLNAGSCEDYAMLEECQKALPECQVVYEVSLGGKSFAPDTTELTLEVGDYDYDTLMENLSHLAAVQSITLRMPELTLEQIGEMKTAFPEIAFSCTVGIGGVEYTMDTTELDLSNITSADVEQIGQKLAMLPELASVELMGSGESSLTKQDVKTLKEAAPNASFHYSFDFYGQTLSTTDEEVHIKNVKIGDDGLDEVRLALDLMENCSRFVLENCQISNEEMAKLRDDYRDKTKVVWRVSFGNGSTLTDADVIRSTYDLVDSNCGNLIYCEDVRFVDFGHNEYLYTVDFVAGMPNLEYAILSGSPIKDLTPFENCTKLKFLEIAFCDYVDDVTPLANCKELQMLNVSNTHVVDLSPLDDLPLTNFCAKMNPSGVPRVSKEEQERFTAQHPDCWTAFYGVQPYGPGWRYDEDEITPLPQYALLQQAFRYPNAPNNVGWYFDENETE